MRNPVGIIMKPQKSKRNRHNDRQTSYAERKQEICDAVSTNILKEMNRKGNKKITIKKEMD